MRAKIESLFRAAEAGDLARVKAIVSEGTHDADGNNQWQSDIDPRGWQRTPLHVAILQGHFHVASWLLDQGADPNPRTKFGDTPLNLVLDPPLPSYYAEAVELLMNHGADPTIENDEGESPISRAQRIPAVWASIGELLAPPRQA